MTEALWKGLWLQLLQFNRAHQKHCLELNFLGGMLFLILNFQGSPYHFGSFKTFPLRPG